MSETTETSTPEVSADAASIEEETKPALLPLNIPSLLECGSHFGHQTRRWNPKMRSYLFGDRNGIHIIDLDQTLPLFKDAVDFVRETAAEGGKVLFVGTKRQAAPSIMTAANESKQYYVNNRWLGGMLTNWKTVKKSIDRYKQIIEITADEERSAELSKKELARLNRLKAKYDKSLAGIKDMSRLPDVMFVVDVGIETIAVSEAKRLGIPIIGIVDSNNDPGDIDFVVPGNDDAIRAIDFYCGHIAAAAIEGDAVHQERLVAEAPKEASREGVAGGRRVVEIKQQPRRARSTQSERGTSGRTASAGGREETESVKSEAAPAAATEEPAAPAATEAPAADPTPETPAAAEGGSES
ncbi:MAG: 30S ribosomal protein S2 [Myxococcota bacterium]|nr:30S ribosomal protein S2 [Myxococcota bacterium]